MIITITSPGYVYKSEMTRSSSPEGGASTSAVSAGEEASLEEFQQILTQKLQDYQARSASGDTTATRALAASVGSGGGQPSVDTGLGFSLPSSLKGIFEEAAEKYGVDLELLETIGYIESGFQTTVTSSSGAMGIMQLMPLTAQNYGVSDAYDARQNIMAGAHVLSDKLKEFGGDVDLACGAYNCGSGAIHRAGDTLTEAAKRYVEKVHRYYSS